MQLGSLVFAGVCGIVGLVAGRATRPSSEIAAIAEAAPPPPVTRAALRPRASTPTPTPTPTLDVAVAADHEAIEDDGQDVGAALAKAQMLANQQVHERHAIRGHVTNSRDGTSLVGCTVIARGANGDQTAITDEHGNYEILGLETANYTIMIFYAEVTMVTSGVVTHDYEATMLDLGLAYPPYEPPSTVEELLGAADDQDDSEVTTFSGI